MRLQLVVLVLCYAILQLIHGGLASTCLSRRDNGQFIRQSYDPDFKICCGGILAQRTTNVDCCNSELFFSDKQLCCNRRIVNKKISKSTKKWEPECDQSGSDCVEAICCGGELIPKADNVMCCDGTSTTLTEDQARHKDYFTCCGKKAFNKLTHMCCDNVFGRQPNLGCCNGDIFDNQKDVCIQGRKLDKTEGLCNGRRYNKTLDTCCDERLIHVPQIIKTSEEPDVYQPNPRAQCCGPSIMDRDQTCCEQKLYGYPTHSIPKHPDFKCCGQVYHNDTAQFCVAGEPREKSPHTIVCGHELIDTRFQDCCANKLPYDNSTHQCCEGADYCVIEKDEKCCNGLHVKKNELCCDNIKPCKKRDENDDSCCFDHEWENGQTFKSGGMLTCNRGQLLPKENENDLPCGRHEVYNPETHFCCGDRKYEHSSGQCCKGVFTNVPKEAGRCCIYNNQAYRYGDPTNPCIEPCNDKRTYDVSHELCCGGRVYNYTGYNYCCGAQAIDSSWKKCCGNQFPYRDGGRKDCCRDTQVYNTQYSTCRADGTVESRQGVSDVEKVCQPAYTKLFDGAVQHACMRKYAITGKVTSVSFDKSSADTLVRFYLRGVKSLRNEDGVKLRNQMRIDVHLGRAASASCSLDHLTRLTSKRVLVFFDDEIKGKNVNVLNGSPFFINKKTFLRYYSVTKAISTSLCKIFSTRS